MKRIFTFYLLLCSSLGWTQNAFNYYWSGQKKIPLIADSTSWVLLPKESSAKYSAISLMRSSSAITAIKEGDGSDIISFNISDYSKKSISALKAKYSTYGKITCSQLVNGKTEILMTGKILLQPKKSIRIEQVLSLIKDRAFVKTNTAYNTFTLEAFDTDEVIELANIIYESGLVDWCHPDFWAEIQRTTNDPLFAQQYYLNQSNNIDINAPEAFALTGGAGCDNIRVAVIDDGVENHEDINGRVLQGFTVRNPNGFGAPVANLPPTGLYTIGHGQACAGIIAASRDNAIGIAGIAPNSRIIPINIFFDWFISTDTQGRQSIMFRETPENIAASINWAWNPLQGNADVISNSWGWPTSGPGGPEADAIIQAITNARTLGRVRNGVTKGCPVIFASGNSATFYTGVTFPANTNGVITVGAIDRNGAILDYSSRGAEMNLVAPSGPRSGDVVTTDREGGNGYETGAYTSTFNGTSAAAPQVSGVAALMLSANPELTETQVRNIIQNSATNMGAAGFDNTFGFGRLNAFGALQSALNSLPTISGSSVVCSSNSTYTINNLPAGTTVSWTASPASLFSITNGTGTNFTTSPISSYTSGNGVISATITNTCGGQNLMMDRTVWVESSNFEPPIEQLNPACTDAEVTFVYPPKNAQTYEWSVSGGTIISGRYSHTMKMIAPSGGAIVQLAIYSACFYNVNSLAFIEYGPGCGGFFSVSPNPSDDYFEVSYQSFYEGETANEALLKATDVNIIDVPNYDLILYNNQREEVFTRKGVNSSKSRTDISNLPSGIYLLHIVADQIHEVKKLIIK